ncbi:KilA-N domain-containing protein [Flavobacterium sp.]|jgi:hypothetical protein|uniref:KilA-N domain-containing protein n=1 Tax=Flavobacterium sp. TaxID=239 RepID=UPI0037C127E0
MKEKKSKIEVQGLGINIISKNNDDYISLTDIARQRDTERSDYILQNWLRNRSTIEFIGLWEQLRNPIFNSIEFDGIKNASGSNSFSLTPKRWIETTNAIGIISKTEWRDENPNLEGNIRDYATIEQLLVLANIESLNAEFIRMEFSQKERLLKLNQIAIIQIKSITKNINVQKLNE